MITTGIQLPVWCGKCFNTTFLPTYPGKCFTVQAKNSKHTSKNTEPSVVSDIKIFLKKETSIMLL